MAREMKDSGIEWIGEIPEEWEVLKNKYIFENVKNIVGNNFEDYQLLSLTTKGVKEKSVNDVSGKVPESYATYQEVKKDDMILCLFDLDVSAVFSGKSPYNGMISPAYKIFKCNSLIIPKYAERLFEFIGFGRKYMAYSKSLRYTINIDIFNEILSIYPPLPTQQRIAFYLDEKCKEIDSIIENTKSTIEEYKKYKYSVIADAVTMGLHTNVTTKNSGVDWIESVPKNWDIIKLKYIFFIKKEIANKFGYDILSVTQNGLKVKDISNNEGQISSDYSKYQIVEPNDFVMNHMDLLTGWVDCSIFYGVTSPDYRVFRLDDESKALREYFKYIFQLCYKHKIFYGLGQGVSNMGRWRLQTDKFINFEVPLPSIDEQKEIVEFLDIKCTEIDILISQKQQLLTQLQAYKKSLIYECVTGKVEV